MARFRVEKTKDFTVMSNYHLRDRSLSLKAKGLLSQMLSLPDDWDYTLEGLSKINKEKIDAIRTAVNELINAGYITRIRKRDSNGMLRGSEYVIYERPRNAQINEKPAGKASEPALDLPMLDFSTLENPALENQAQLNIEINKSDEIDTKVKMEKPEETTADKRNKRIQEISLIKEEAIENSRQIYINGSWRRADEVKERLSMVTDEHIEYIADAMERSKKPVKNLKSYILTALWNAPLTFEHYHMMKDRGADCEDKKARAHPYKSNKKPNRFNDFDQREYDWDEIEKELFSLK